MYVLSGALLIGFVLFLLFSSKFSVAGIEVARDNLNIDSSKVAQLMQPYKGKSIFLLSKRKIRHLIQEAYPEFADIKIKKILPNTVEIELQTHDIVANVRAYYILPEMENPPPDNLEEQTSQLMEALGNAFSLEGDDQPEDKKDVEPIEQKALLNRIGQAIFDREEDLQLMTITIEGLTQPIEDRQIVVPESVMTYMLDTIKYLTNMMTLEVTEIKYLPVAREIHLVTANNLTLWLSLDKSYKDQIDRLNTIYKVAELDKEDLAYIDLRIKEKVIYCPRGARCDR